MASQTYNKYKLEALKGSIVPLTDTIKLALIKSTYTPDIDADTFFSDIVAKESSGTGYTTGGVTAANKTITQDNANDRAIFDCDDAQWPSSVIADARWLVVYKYTGSNATSPLMAVIDLLGATQSTNGGTFYVQFAAVGVFYLS